MPGKYWTQEQLAEHLRRQQGEKSQRKFAKELGISRTMLFYIYSGEREPSEPVLKRLGLERMVLYVKTSSQK